MVEQLKRKKTRTKSQKEEKEEELLVREHMVKKRYKLSIASTLVRPTTTTSVPQRWKDLSETDEEDEDLLQVVLQKRKAVALVSPTPKRDKKVQPASKPWVYVIPSRIQRHIKTRATKSNPRISNKEWAVSFTRNKKDKALSSSGSESTNDTPISSLKICFLYTTASTSITRSSREIQKGFSKGTFKRCSEVSSSIH